VFHGLFLQLINESERLQTLRPSRSSWEQDHSLFTASHWRLLECLHVQKRSGFFKGSDFFHQSEILKGFWIALIGWIKAKKVIFWICEPTIVYIRFVWLFVICSVFSQKNLMLILNNNQWLKNDQIINFPTFYDIRLNATKYL